MAVFFIEAMNTLFSEQTAQVIFRWHGTTIPWKGDSGLYTEKNKDSRWEFGKGQYFVVSPACRNLKYSQDKCDV